MFRKGILPLGFLNFSPFVSVKDVTGAAKLHKDSPSNLEQTPVVRKEWHTDHKFKENFADFQRISRNMNIQNGFNF